MSLFLTTIGVPSGPIVLAIELPLASVSYQTSPFLCSLLSDLPDFKVSLDLADIASEASFNSSAVELNEDAALDIESVDSFSSLSLLPKKLPNILPPIFLPAFNAIEPRVPKALVWISEVEALL